MMVSPFFSLKKIYMLEIEITISIHLKRVAFGDCRLGSIWFNAPFVGKFCYLIRVLPFTGTLCCLEMRKDMFNGTVDIMCPRSGYERNLHIEPLES